MTMAVKAEARNGHELAPLARDGVGVTIVVPPGAPGSRGSVGSIVAVDRAAWNNKLQFFLSIIGYSVGLGNIWRFPYLCQQNGGGAFLIPFAVMLVLEGIPLFLIELGIGQRMRLGSMGVWNTIHPWLGGIGIASGIVTFLISLYYNVIITWCFYYLFNSFQSPLPWASCPVINGTEIAECAKSSETAYFWYRTTLDASPAIDDPQGLKWWIVVLLLLAWTTVFCIVMKGIQSSGKVVYFTSLFPYIVLTIFFIRGLTLEGAKAGIIHMYTPKVEKLLDPTVWLDAATQVFYSFGLAFGSLIAFGSYNPPKNNCVRDVILVSIANACTAIYASVVIFSILGFKAMTIVHKCIDGNTEKLLHIGFNVSKDDYEDFMNNFGTNDTIKALQLEDCSLEKQLDEAAEGTGLAFIVFTKAIVELPFSPFWSLIFFMMLLALGLGSQIGILEGMLCTIFDIEILKRVRKQYITAAVCIVCFFVGLLFCSGAGEYWLKLFDSFGGTIGLVLVALLETVAVMYVYGHEKFTKDIEDMTGYRPGIYWQITWRLLGPLLMTVILVTSVIFMIINKPKYHAWNAELGKTVATDYPDWVMGIAICMVVAGILPMPIVFILRRCQCLKLDVNIHQGSIRRIETTVSTKEMMGDVDVETMEPPRLPYSDVM
ncbi:sodium-dependent neutral amino acid transporter B(0)AT3 isoform X2 [Schistocerca gregaria]|uniref:sodium-dependent neutral amino acid transporter B(0)AT3 isoform X2 n=1 Tax=Schistocerca gregaria TaxID=7010 RepID=UPI00211E3C99|nr:sodium-dependent neutral amino acid transporter B(0)AT3 isoform X2 [Schistocerca gregaria]